MGHRDPCNCLSENVLSYERGRRQPLSVGRRHLRGRHRAVRLRWRIRPAVTVTEGRASDTAQGPFLRLLGVVRSMILLTDVGPHCFPLGVRTAISFSLSATS